MRVPEQRSPVVAHIPVLPVDTKDLETLCVRPKTLEV